jgi:hypothetical protein
MNEYVVNVYTCFKCMVAVLCGTAFHSTLLRLVGDIGHRRVLGFFDFDCVCAHV